MDTNGHTHLYEDYVSFEIAKLLKEKGFPQELGEIGCINKIPYYTQNGGFVTSDLNTIRQRFYPEAIASTLQMAMKWLMEEKNIYIDITSRFSLNADRDVCFSYSCKKLIDTYKSSYEVEDGEWLNYEEACEAAIMYCLSNLI